MTQRGPEIWDERKEPLFGLLYILVATPLSIFVGLLLGKFFLPLSQATFVFPVYFRLLTRSGARRTVALMGVWALLTAILMVLSGLYLTDFLRGRVLLGDEYRQEMFFWIRTGAGAEGDITRFLPEHLFHLLLFALLTVVSAGFLGLFMGAVLMNYMSYYVAAVVAQASDPLVASILAWPPWAAIRVFAYIVVAVSLSAVSLKGIRGAKMGSREILTGLAAGFALLLLDVLLKWQLAPYWQRWLGSLVVF